MFMSSMFVLPSSIKQDSLSMEDNCNYDTFHSHYADMNRRSLISNYVLCIDVGHESLTTTSWTLFPIDKFKSNNNDLSGIGHRAIVELHKTNLTATETLQITLCLEDPMDFNDIVRVKVQMTPTSNNNDNDYNFDDMQKILSKVMVQYLLRLNMFRYKEDTKIQIGDNPDETYQFSSLISPYGHASLFASHLNGIDLSKVEMSDMVNGNGIPLGSIPRPLLHKYNVLHRGIGLVVCDKEHIHPKRADYRNDLIYCHRRSSTKRIYPSLYDMFVGGISTAGEDSMVTAEREVSEELGLTRSSLSIELFKCLICTGYNRCIVSLFTYRYDVGEGDKIKWQKEEVDWGGFERYKKIEQAAALSVERLIQQGKWPGNESDLKFIRDNFTDSCVIDEPILEWDFVPDGLLVWMAWLKWMKNGVN